MSLDLNPDIERQVLAGAHAAGITASDYIARLLQAAASVASPDPIAGVRSLLNEWQQRDHTPIATPEPNDGTFTPSEVLFREWEQEDATLPDEAPSRRGSVAAVPVRHQCGARCRRHATALLMPAIIVLDTLLHAQYPAATSNACAITA